MRERFKTSELLTARVLVWSALSLMLLWYVRWGSELVAVTSFYHIRRSVPYIWNAFHQGLPEIGNKTLLDLVYWSAIAVCLLGVFALLWYALAPSPKESAPTEGELPPA